MVRFACFVCFILWFLLQSNPFILSCEKKLDRNTRIAVTRKSTFFWSWLSNLQENKWQPHVEMKNIPWRRFKFQCMFHVLSRNFVKKKSTCCQQVDTKCNIFILFAIWDLFHIDFLSRKFDFNTENPQSFSHCKLEKQIFFFSSRGSNPLSCQVALLRTLASRRAFKCSPARCESTHRLDVTSSATTAMNQEKPVAMWRRVATRIANIQLRRFESAPCSAHLRLGISKGTNGNKTTWLAAAPVRLARELYSLCSLVPLSLEPCLSVLSGWVIALSEWLRQPARRCLADSVCLKCFRVTALTVVAPSAPRRRRWECEWKKNTSPGPSLTALSPVAHEETNILNQKKKKTPNE